MQYLNRLLKSVLSRRALMAAAAVAAAAAIWFVGPLVALGDLHPLDSVLSRALSIVLLFVTLLFGLFGWSYGFIVVALACTALWYLGPSLRFGEVHPLEERWSRILMISILLACYAVYELYRLWKALRGNDALLQRILNPQAEASDAGPRQHDEIRVVESKIAKAIEKLKRIRGGRSGLGRLLESQRHLYKLPWYMVLGAGEAGKTTLILNSGLEFPEADQMARASEKRRVRTANCDWWFTNKAVWIDTAGRYAVQHAPVQDDGSGDDRARINAAEWRGFLAQLHKRRSRAPINGVLLTVSVETLLTRSVSEREAFAASMRARLDELYGDLGVRVPIYMVVTKLDLLPGFCEYFDMLTAEDREQVFGFTLPYRDGDLRHGDDQLRLDCAVELVELERRIEDGIGARLKEAYEVERRKKLYALPSEFRSLCAELNELISQMFLDSTYDDTRLHGMLRGVYFTSAAQNHEQVTADVSTVMQRLRRGLAKVRGDDTTADRPASDRTKPVGNRGYFVRDLFRHVIVTEGHLVRPNRRWEMRFHVLRLVGHLTVVVVAAWLIGSLSWSFENNREYLAAVDRKAEALASRVAASGKKMPLDAMAPVLSAAHDLPKSDDLNPEAPAITWRYGMYTGRAVHDVADKTYRSLLHRMLLPEIAGRIESVLASEIDAGNADGAYRTLSVYLMLGDRSHYDQKAIKGWVASDWENGKIVASPKSLDIMTHHLDALLADGMPVMPAKSLDLQLVKRARDFVGRVPAPGRLYERALAAMAGQAPENVTMSRAAGPQALLVLALAEGSTLERGIPGLYTYEGYREVFDKRLPEFLDRTRKQDAWVMGQADGLLARSVSLANGNAPRSGKDELSDEIRRQYLTDYGNYWRRFVDDVRLVRGDDDLPSLDMQALRMLAAPDSPLVRLVRTIVSETSLAVNDGAGEPSLADAAMTQATKSGAGGIARAASAAGAMGAAMDAGRPSRRKMERELVDDRFAELRDIVTGRRVFDGRAAMMRASSDGGDLPRLDGVVGLVGREYMRLSMINDALASGSMPPAENLRSAMQFEAETLPAPLRAVLGSIASRSSEQVESGVRSLLASQIDSGVGAQCRSAIEGKYPFADSMQEVDIDDFNRMFAAGGLFDDFFRKTLANRVDTDARPWRYKPVASGVPPMREPDLASFEHAAAIRQTFFRDPGAARMSWEMRFKVVSMDPEITDLLIDIDGQSTRYAHGPVTTIPVTWPGPRGGAVAGITANPRIRPDTSTLVAEGPWALLRLIDRARVTSTSSANRNVADFAFDGRHAALELTSGNHSGLQLLDLLRRFRCPGSESTRRTDAYALLRFDGAR
ncbi:type VI secretion system membrane subunit TssM [Burkholderia cepacia]|uniref:type VI secretion system membrane subunit TssM n=1 Tax=Burkholderia cepacia TaxID=292 RepID=UPI003526D340